jgi:hypothetical protein
MLFRSFQFFPFVVRNNPHADPPRTPLFWSLLPSQSGHATGPVSPKFRNRARTGPGLGSSDPLFAAKLLEFSHKQGVRQIFTILHLTSEKCESGGYGAPKHRNACGTGRSCRAILPETAIFSDVKTIISQERS